MKKYWKLLWAGAIFVGAFLFLGANLTLAAPPEPLTSITLTATGQTTATATWTETPGAGYYYIMISTASTFPDWSGGLGGYAPMTSYNFTNLTPGTTYYAYIAGVNTGEGWSWNVPTRSNAITTDPYTPTITSKDANGDTFGAFISWYVNDPAYAAVSTVEYGLTSEYGNSVSGQQGWAGSYWAIANIHNLQPNSTYHYKITTGTGTENITSGDGTFTTKAEPFDSLNSEPDRTSAYVYWWQDPVITNSVVEYGLTTGYGSSSVGIQGEGWYVQLENLQPNTTYHYKIVDTSGGEYESSDQTFTTLPPQPNIVFIDSSWSKQEDVSNGLIWQINAFNNFGDALSAVEENGTIQVLAGTYYYNEQNIYKKGVNLVGPGKNATDKAYIVSGCDYSLNISNSDITVSGFVFQQTNNGEVYSEGINSYCYEYPTIIVTGDNSDGGNATGINIEENEIAGGYRGINLRGDASDVTVSGNYIHSNQDGITVSNSQNAAIENNVIKNNSEYGVWLRSGGGYGSTLSGASIENNTFEDNLNADIFIDSNARDVANCSAHQNRFSKNDLGVLNNKNTVFNAENNYWGDVSGPKPYDESSPAAGEGASVSAYVDFDPFLLTGSPVNNGPTEEKFKQDISLGFIEVSGSNPIDTSKITFNADYTIVTGDARVVIPAGTEMTKTGGGSLDFTQMTMDDITAALQNSSLGANIAGAVSIGIPNLKLSFSRDITVTIPVPSLYNGQSLSIYYQNSGESDWSGGLVCEVSDGKCIFQTNHATKYSAGDKPVVTVITAKKAKIKSWDAYQYQDLGSDLCQSKLRVSIKGKYFDEDASVRIGTKKAFSVEYKSSNKIIAKFCLDRLLKTKTDHSKNVIVENPNTDEEKADRQINLDEVSYELTADNLDNNTVQGVKNIQTALKKLGYLQKENITGMYGPITTQGIQRFQSDNGISQTGFFGSMTRAKLAEKVK